MIEKRSDENLRCLICGGLVDESSETMTCPECAGSEKSAADGRPPAPRTLRELVHNSDE